MDSFAGKEMLFSSYATMRGETMKAKWIFVLLAIVLVMPLLPAVPTDAQLASSPSPMYRFNAAHSGQSAYPGPVSVEVLWSFSTYDRIRSTPAIGQDGTIYFGDGYQFLHALTPTGGEKWNYFALGIMDSSPAVSTTGTVYIGCGDSIFYALWGKPKGSGFVGEMQWAFLCGYPNSASPLIGSDGTVYLASGDRKLYARTPDNKQKALPFSAGGSILSSPAQDSSGNLYFGCEDGYLYSVTPSLTLRWKYQTMGGIGSSPALDSQGNIYFGSKDFFCYSLDSSGNLRWKFETGGPVLSSPAVTADGRAIFSSLDFSVYALEAGSGKKLWSFATKSPVDTSPTVDSLGHIFFGGQDKYFYCLNSDGEQIWNRLFPNGFSRSSAVIGPDYRVYVGCEDGKLYCLTGQAPVPSPTPTPTPTATATPSIILSLMSNPAEVSLAPGRQATFNLNLHASETASLQGAWEFSGPPGLQGIFLPPTFLMSGADFQSNFQLSVPAGFPAGRYAVELRAVSGSLIARTTVSILIQTLSFPDVSMEYWAFSSIDSLVGLGIVRGYPDGTFKPENPVTRAEFTKMLLLTLNLQPTQASKSTFSDLATNHWAQGYVEAAVAYGLVQGYPDGTFRPEGKVTMAETITLIVRAKRWALIAPPQVYTKDMGLLRPLGPTDWYYLYAGAAFANQMLRIPDPNLVQVVNGTPTVPFNDPATRAQVSVLLARTVP